MILTLLISLLLLQVAEGNTFSSAKYYADATENVSPSAGSDASVMPGSITVASSEGQAALQGGRPEAAGDSRGQSPLRDERAEDGGAAINVSEIIFEHIGDEYEWHITEWKGKSVAIPLPCIVIDKGVHVFTAHHAAENGYTFNENGKLINADTGKRPLDLSITKNVLSVMMSSLLLLIVVLLTARWYKKHDAMKEAPTGLANAVESLVRMVDEMAYENIGEKDYRKYSPYLCMAFLWILLNNFMGIIPFFPGGANLTGNIAITLVLALCTFFTVNLTGSKHYYKEMLWNPDSPVFMRPVMAIIEVFSALMKPVSLTVRLFANMLAGHIMILCMVCVIFIMAKYGPLLSGGMTVVSVLFGVFLDALECLVAFIQAYVFTMLSSIYIGLARSHGE